MLNLDHKIKFLTNAEIKFGFNTGLKFSLKLQHHFTFCNK